jgi:hypothetical protein
MPCRFLRRSILSISFSVASGSSLKDRPVGFDGGGPMPVLLGLVVVLFGLCEMLIDPL